MKFRSARGRREDVHVDLTAAVDVVFNIILFLLLSSTFKRPEEDVEKGPETPAIKVDLPRASAHAVITGGEDINVWIATDGGMFLDDVPTTIPELRRRFRAAAAEDTSTLVIIKADKGTPHGRVVNVMDAAREEGLQRLAIATAAE